MDLLVIGGTSFLGRHFAASALARGHQVTLFHRGKTNPGLFPTAEEILGDRKEDLSALSGQTWDGVLDTCGYFPRVVRQSADALAGSVSRYLFVSSISVYDGLGEPGHGGEDESSPVARIADPTVEEITGETYGALKALCEEAVQDVYGHGAIIVRPGLIVGPYDPSDRFTYWPRRVATGGRVLAPGRPDRLVQIIDGRDLGEWMVKLFESGASGVFNATGPASPVTMAEILESCRDVAGGDAEFIWVDDDTLTGAGVGAYVEMPLWVPQSDDDVSIAKALAAGLTTRPLADIVRDTLAWDYTRPADTPRRAGLAPEREAQILAAWEG